MPKRATTDQRTQEKTDAPRSGNRRRACAKSGPGAHAQKVEPGKAVPPACAAPVPKDELPHALTFFLTHGQRRAVLAVLARYRQPRAVALLYALGLEKHVQQ